MHIKVRALVAGMALVFAHGAAQAGSAVLAMGEGEQVRAEYLPERLRIDPSKGSDGTMILRDGKLYVVAGGQVFETGSLKQLVSSLSSMLGTSHVSSVDQGRFIGLNATSRQETIAGITGQVHEFVYEDEKGQRQTEELVLAKDPRARELTDAFLTLLSAQDLIERAEVQLLADSFKGQGILRAGQDMKVVSFGPDPVASRFDLPGKPQPLPDLSGLGALLGGAAAAAAAQGGQALPGGIDPARMMQDMMRGQNLSPEQQRMMQEMMKSMGGGR